MRGNCTIILRSHHILSSPPILEICGNEEETNPKISTKRLFVSGNARALRSMSETRLPSATCRPPLDLYSGASFSTRHPECSPHLKLTNTRICDPTFQASQLMQDKVQEICVEDMQNVDIRTMLRPHASRQAGEPDQVQYPFPPLEPKKNVSKMSPVSQAPPLPSTALPRPRSKSLLFAGPHMLVPGSVTTKSFRKSRLSKL